MSIRRKRLQNRISESRWTVAATTIMALSVWVIVCINDSLAIVPLLCMLFSTFLMMELNNTNALIRIFSRMVSCSYMALTTMATFLFVSMRAVWHFVSWVLTLACFVVIKTDGRKGGCFTPFFVSDLAVSSGCRFSIMSPLSGY